MKYLLSTEPDGVELKSFGEKINLKFSWYFSFIKNGVEVRYFKLTRARMRPILEYLSDNIKNKSNIKVFIVTPTFCKFYTCDGRLRSLDICLNVGRIMRERYYIQLFSSLFGLKVRFKQFKFKREGLDKVEISYTLQSNVFTLKINTKGYSAFLNGDEIEFDADSKNFIDRFWYNKIYLKKKNLESTFK